MIVFMKSWKLQNIEVDKNSKQDYSHSDNESSNDKWDLI